MKVAVNLTQTLSQNLSNHWDGLCTLKHRSFNVEIHSPESNGNTLETNDSLKHDRISQQLYVEEESLYHKHDTENKPYEAFNVFDTNPLSKSK
jgi:hypothetical protein